MIEEVTIEKRVDFLLLERGLTREFDKICSKFIENTTSPEKNFASCRWHFSLNLCGHNVEQVAGEKRVKLFTSREGLPGHLTDFAPNV